MMKSRHALRGTLLLWPPALRPTLTHHTVPPRHHRSVHQGWSTLPPRSNEIHARFNRNDESTEPVLTTGPAAALARRVNTTPLRTGVLAIKKGMTSVYKGSKHIPCTVLQLDRVQVVANKTFATHGYWAVQIGMGARNPHNVPHAQLGYYEAKGMAPKLHLAEFMVRDEHGLLPVGAQLLPDWFKCGQMVDVRAKSRGMGFAGGMKRHGWAGQPASHGNSLSHRAMGSAGPSQGSGSRVIPGKRMAGRMGNEWKTVQNLRVMKVDNELGIVVVHGAVPGPDGRMVRLQDAKKRKAPSLPHRTLRLEELMARYGDGAQKLVEARRMHLELKRERHGEWERPVYRNPDDIEDDEDDEDDEVEEDDQDDDDGEFSKSLQRGRR